ncbi:hypothetical protein BDV37DRAFT_244704 [Aspergillus pseudonomiae]|uniref:Uncharacterized protein n=1 Tax=Aspergillus pseudonomiae TaxID=1506151 RepID=A0A5N7DHD6_9EURO|nr:uncharacterized protein BDV37DRAFT_244704 [Aspergillus pseudonomiae]KAE8405807.1 hypothetical protein BDV37DRAFT_244704 [Aspergillus pseudonomiae]
MQRCRWRARKFLCLAQLIKSSMHLLDAAMIDMGRSDKEQPGAGRCVLHSANSRWRRSIISGGIASMPYRVPTQNLCHDTG